MTEPRDAARLLAVGRIVIGAALVLAPKRAGAGWIGDAAERDETTVLARALGVRDVLLGAMVLHTVDHPDVAPRWLSATAACDAVDFAAGVAARDSLPRFRGALGMAVAGGAAAAGLALSRSLGEG